MVVQMFNTLDVQWVKAFAILIRRNHTKYSKCDWWNDGFLHVQGWLCTNWGLRPFWALCCLTRYQPQVKATQIARPPDPQSIHMLSAVCQQNSHWPFEAQVGNWKRKLSFATASWPFEERLPDDCKHIFLQDLFTSDFRHVMMTTMIIRAVRGTFSPQTGVLPLWKLIRKRPHKMFRPSHPGKPIHPTFTSNFPNRQSNNY